MGGVDWPAILLAVLPSLIAAVAAWLVSRLTSKFDASEADRLAEERAQRERMEAVEKGLRAAMRTELLDAHERYVAKGEPLGYNVLTHLEDVYESYHGLGGNGSGTLLWQAIQQRFREAS